MNKKLQRKILELIKIHNQNPQTGELWTGMEEKIFTVLGKNYQSSEIKHNLSLLEDEGKIKLNCCDKFGTKYHGSVRLTPSGYREFAPWYIKFWRFFKGDFVKILSIIATILAIVATILSIIALTK